MWEKSGLGMYAWLYVMVFKARRLDEINQAMSIDIKEKKFRD